MASVEPVSLSPCSAAPGALPSASVLLEPPSPLLPKDMQLRLLRSQLEQARSALTSRGNHERALATRAERAEGESAVVASERNQLRRAITLAERAQAGARAAVEGALQRERAALAEGVELRMELHAARERERRAAEAHAPDARSSRAAAQVETLTVAQAELRASLTEERAARGADASRAAARTRVLERHLEAISLACTQQVLMIDVLKRKIAHLEVAATLNFNREELSAARGVSRSVERR